MPRGILSRLIVRLHQNIYQQTHWYYGVLLAWGGTRALVREERANHRLLIKTEGSDRRGMLAIICHAIEEINTTFGPKLQVVEEIPCTCPICVTRHEPHFFPYTRLQSYLTAGRHEIVCDNEPHHAVNIQRLIEAVIPPARDEEEAMGLLQHERAFGDIHAEQVIIHMGRGQPVDEAQTMEDSMKKPSNANQATPPTKRVNNAWINGSFFLVALTTIVALFAWISNQVRWHTFPIVLIAGLLSVGVIGALQLRNDDRLGEKPFIQLMIETYKRLPLLRKHQS
jgi:hypothetical protein